jgi:PilZ domain
MSTAISKPHYKTRKDLRYPQLCELSMNYEGSTEDIIVRPPDLSAHGMFVNTAKELPNGAILKLKFRLARTGVVVQTRAEVRYCLRGVGVGVEFVGISAEAEQAIKEEISAQVSRS